MDALAAARLCILQELLDAWEMSVPCSTGKRMPELLSRYALKFLSKELELLQEIIDSLHLEPAFLA